ncbi:MAG: prepilin peptidase, partial [Gemmataceae bacterium]|nr:prepilin peptidase [Gemmataceae bacterium]
MDWLSLLPAAFWSAWVFALGLMVGSFINVVAARLPYEKSLVWPSSRCFACYTPIRLTDNVPILGYLRLKGRCRACGAGFSSRYLWVELLTGAAFLALFVLEVLLNWHQIPGMKFDPKGPNGMVPPVPCIALFVYHAFLLAGLIAAAVVDAEHHVIPAAITYPVMLV